MRRRRLCHRADELAPVTTRPRSRPILGRVSQFVDEAQLNVRGGDGGAGRSRSGGRRTRPRAAPTAVTAAAAATSAPGRPQRRLAPRVPRPPPPARHVGQPTAPASAGTAPTAPTSSSPFPRERSCATHEGERLADLVSHGDSYLAARGGRGGRGQRPVPLQRTAGAEVRRAGRVRRGALAPPRAQAHGRRRARRVPQRGQVDAHLDDLRGQARRSPTTRSPRSSPTSAWSASRTTSSSSPTCPG